jgi:diguanylate cyclase (GGDEF)-like protein/PAS domain S-box-containing protein
MFPVSIRYTIPLLIVVFTAILALYTVQKEWSAAEAIVRGRAVSDLLDRMTLLHKQLSYASISGDHERIKQEMSLLESARDPQIAMLADDRAVVLDATKEQWVGQPLTEVARTQWRGWSGEPLQAIINRVTTERAGELFLTAGGRNVLGIYPVELGARGDSLAGDRVGVVLVQRDLSGLLSQVRHTVGKQWAETAGVLATLAVLLGILLHLLVTRRLNTLLMVTQRFATGDLDARSKLRGNDEVAILSRAFDRMAGQIADTQRQLEQRVQQRTLELGETVCELKAEVAERRRIEKTLFDEKERIRVTLASIGDGVIATDVDGRVEYLNPSAERLTGWTKMHSTGQLLYQVFSIVDESTRDPVVSHMQRYFPDVHATGLAINTLLICRDGQERSIDYSASPIHDQEGAAVGAVLVFRDVTEARLAAHELRYQASHDSLTGLVNRREFEYRLEQILATSAPEESSAMVYLDLDQFKVINDTCGHVAGDALLHRVGEILSAQVRKRDTVARLGGDEFAALIENCHQDQALRIALKLSESIRDFRFVWQDQGFTIGASLGLVPIEPGIDTVASIFRAADSACYVAKEQGRNRVHVYKRDDQEVAQRHGEMQWVLRIQEALAENRFTLFYQPIVSLNRSDRRHGEVLLRLLDREGGLVSPGAFIPAAERYNQMQAIDRWVIRTVFAALGDSDIFPPSACVAINVSGQSLGDRNFLEFIEQQVEEGLVPMERICFEITETAAISNLSHAMRLFSELKGRGCYFALDDFGSGLSSFAYLKSLPVDFLKIDGSFIRDMMQDPIDCAMVEAIHRIGHVMGIETIAESVEHESTLTHLRDIGVNYAQGYQVGRPRPLALAPYGSKTPRARAAPYSA